jgi:death on curing protein
MTEPRWVSVAFARAVHLQQLAEHGGLPGVRDENLLESALARPRNLWHYGDPAPDLSELAAAYAFGIARNHPFSDGNKRVALVVSFAFLRVNGYVMTTTQRENALEFEAMAGGERTEEQMSQWIRTHSRRREEA